MLFRGSKFIKCTKKIKNSTFCKLHLAKAANKDNKNENKDKYERYEKDYLGTYIQLVVRC